MLTCFKVSARLLLYRVLVQQLECYAYTKHLLFLIFKLWIVSLLLYWFYWLGRVLVLLSSSTLKDTKLTQHPFLTSSLQPCIGKAGMEIWWIHRDTSLSREKLLTGTCMHIWLEHTANTMSSSKELWCFCPKNKWSNKKCVRICAEN